MTRGYRALEYLAPEQSPWGQCMTFMLGATLTATADPAGATVVVSARTGPATTALVVPIARMTWARMVRRIRMICLHASTEVDSL
jgi:hypothetical protein